MICFKCGLVEGGRHYRCQCPVCPLHNLNVIASDVKAVTSDESIICQMVQCLLQRSVFSSLTNKNNGGKTIFHYLIAKHYRRRLISIDITHVSQ